MPGLEDSNGLIAFATFASDQVTGVAEYHTGKAVCDKIANYFAARHVVYELMGAGRVQPMPDPSPASQWDSPVTHYLFSRLTTNGVLTDYQRTEKRYSRKQPAIEFTREFVRRVFDPSQVSDQHFRTATPFMVNLATSVRDNWKDRTAWYTVGLFVQSHEAAPHYTATIKYFSVSLSPDQRSLVSDCTSAEMRNFDFYYGFFSARLPEAVLDYSSEQYVLATRFLKEEPTANHADAQNQLQLP